MTLEEVKDYTIKCYQNGYISLEYCDAVHDLVQAEIERQEIRDQIKHWDKDACYWCDGPTLCEININVSYVNGYTDEIEHATGRPAYCPNCGRKLQAS